jgi:hypothetical protein
LKLEICMERERGIKKGEVREDDDEHETMMG